MRRTVVLLVLFAAAAGASPISNGSDDLFPKASGGFGVQRLGEEIRDNAGRGEGGEYYGTPNWDGMIYGFMDPYGIGGEGIVAGFAWVNGESRGVGYSNGPSWNGTSVYDFDGWIVKEVCETNKLGELTGALLYYEPTRGPAPENWITPPVGPDQPVHPSPVPEPSTWMLAALGLAGCAVAKFDARKRSARRDSLC
ncbi:MAG: PEP-CTERM sorting domain-containing protein [Acidobacteriota bacterium]